MQGHSMAPEDARGHPFDCGRERIYSDTPKEELDRLTIDGHAKFLELLQSLNIAVAEGK